jgi:hypothetical protein
MKARVRASSGQGLQAELIARDWDDYRALVERLSVSRGLRLARLRRRLAARCKARPLFTDRLLYKANLAHASALALEAHLAMAGDGRGDVLHTVDATELRQRRRRAPHVLLPAP